MTVDAEDLRQPGASAPSAGNRIRVAVVDDHAIVRAGTRRLLEEAPDLVVVGEADTAETTLALVEETQPDVVLLDVRLPGVSGVEVARRLIATAPATRVLMLSVYDDPDYVTAALDAGAAGYLLKSASGTLLAAAVRSVHTGAVVLDPALVGNLAQRLVVKSTGELSPRESEVLELVSEGMSNEAIASRLGISRRTVEAHLSHLYAKLDSESREVLIKDAPRRGAPQRAGMEP